jgi:hypothetical protein
MENISELLKSIKFKPVEYTCPRNIKNDPSDLYDLYLEETFVFGDIIYSMEEDKKSHKYVLKRGRENIMTCYEPHLDKVAADGKENKANLIKFGKKLEAIFGKLMIELSKTIKNFNKATSDDIEKMYRVLFTKGETYILGGKNF